MDTYPCPACGGVADETNGCRSCGRPHNPVAATLALLNQRLSGLDDESRRLNEELRTERGELQAEADTLRNALVQQLTAELGEAETGGATRVAAPPTRTPTRRTSVTDPTTASTGVRPVDYLVGPTPPRPRPPQSDQTQSDQTRADQTRTDQTQPDQTQPDQTQPDQTRTDQTRPDQLSGARPYDGPRTQPLVQEPEPETSPRSAQNTLLTLGGVLLGIAAIVFTALFYTTTATGGRAFILGVGTMLALAVPLLLTRRTLNATAETIAAFGLLLVLLDGYAAYSADLAGIRDVSLTLFSAVLFGLVAGVAAAYRLASHLRAPQFAALLAVQPFLPLIAADRQLGREGFAAVFAVVAALNLASVELLSRDLSRAIARVRLPGANPGPGGQAWPRRLRELAWILFGATLAGSVGLALIGMVQATTVNAAIRSALVLLLAAAVGVVGGRMSGRDQLAQISSGAAALAVIASVSRVNTLALPEYTLVLTAAVAAAIAIGSSQLPEHSRRGWALGSLLGAALTAAVVAVEVLRTTYSAIQAAVTPHVWAADVSGYAEQVHTSTWQVPAAAVLLGILAVAVAPRVWKVDALVGAGLVVTLALPGTGVVEWWAVPVIAAVVSTAASGAALYARHSKGALIRAGSAGVLGIYAVATSLARPELTAAVCAGLTLISAGIVVLTAGWPGRFGPYADRVADSAGGGAAFTLPLAVGTFAWLGGAAGSVLVPMTLVATAIGVLGAALSQVAAKAPRTASAGGALLAAIGCGLLSVRADGADLADLGVAALLLGAAGATTGARAFEVSGGGLFAGLRATPAAVAALVDSVDGVVDRPEPPTKASRPRVDGTTAAAALATAALIVAMARLGAVAIPGIGLVTTIAMVLVVSLGVPALPEAWRLGPRLGAGAVGGTIVVVTAGVAVLEAARAVAAATPFWAADLVGWPDRVAGVAPYGWQVPLSLLLAAGAAFALLPAPAGGDVGFVTASLAGLALPAVFALPWWSAALIATIFAVLAGLGAALVTPADPAGTHWRRLGLAGVLGLYATAAASATTGGTALMLSTIVAAAVLVAGLAHTQGTAPAAVPGVATAAALTAGPGAAATLAVANDLTRVGVLGSALALTAFGVFVVAALRAARVRWGIYPAAGVGIASLLVAIGAAIPDPVAAQVWAAGAALVATAGAAMYRMAAPTTVDAVASDVDGVVSDVDGVVSDAGGQVAPVGRTEPGVTAVVLATAVPAALLAAAVSAPAWLTALVGPYRTLRQVWAGYAVAPEPQHAGMAVLTLLLLTGVTAGVALTLGGRRYLLAAVLPPLAAAALVLPTAAGAPRGLTPWVALAVALITGLGAALSRPTQTTATTLLRGTAGLVCAATGGAGVAGSLATPSTTLAALGIVLVGALVAAGLGQDPAARTVAWIVAAAAGFALPPTVLLAAGRELRPAAFGGLTMCAVFVGIAWLLGRTPTRRAEAPVVELCAALGATFALLLTLDSARHLAAVLTIWGLLLGAAALRRDRPARWQHWLVRAAVAAELGACWLLLYSVEIGLTEAYTLPFAAVALLLGALELRRRHELSSWIAYGPALAGGFLPSLALVIVGEDPVWRWVTMFVVAVAIVIIGSWRGRQAPAVTGAAVAMVTAVTEMIRLLVAGRIFGALLVALAGVILILFGAISETRLRGVRRMS